MSAAEIRPFGRMSAAEIRPFGSWISPISAAMVAAGELRIADLQVDGDDVYWVEGRPADGGRGTLVHCHDGHVEDITTTPLSVRTSVHEYGGGAFRVDHGAVYFSNASDGRLYWFEPGDGPRPLTPDLGDVRYADIMLDRTRARLVCVVEDHRGSAVANELRTVAIGGGEPTTLIAGNDFYAAPRLSPDASQLAWLTWNHPNMPWDGNELWLAEVDTAGELHNARLVAGGPRESILQPSWSARGVLHFCSDRTGWWNLYRIDDPDTITALAPMDADCGRPQWAFGQSTYALLDDGTLIIAAAVSGIWRLLRADAGQAPQPIDLPYTDFAYVHARGRSVVALAASPRAPGAVVRIEVGSGAHTVLRSASSVAIPDDVLSPPEAITFRGEGGADAHAFYYPPRNPSFTAPEGELPPLLVSAHGGPTGVRSNVLDAEVQFWTSRGIAYVEVNYGGSSAHGRAYRERVNGASGIVDVGDCVAAARHLVATGRADSRRLLIHGGSAGGYIVLCALAFHDVFAAGASSFGIADLELLQEETHKFESRYGDSLTGPWPAARSVYRERSPIHHLDRVRAAVLLLQGEDDPVVPPNQTLMMFDGLRQRGVPCACLLFAGEQHGFRKASSIQRALEAELSFFSQVSGFPLAEAIEPVEITNLATQ